MTTPSILRVGCAAGFSGDRTDAAAPVVAALIAAGGPAVLIFETLAERTLALAQLARRQNPQGSRALSTLGAAAQFYHRAWSKLSFPDARFELRATGSDTNPVRVYR